MSYNLLSYSSNTATTTKNNAIRTAIEYGNPDILVVQELNSSDAHNVFYSNILDQNIYNLGSFINGNSSDKALYYKKSKFAFIENTPIKTALRDINEFKLLHINSGDTIRVYAVHLQASSGATKENLRNEEVKILRKVTDKLPLDAIYFVCGDFNIYKSYETGYQTLLNQTGSGYFIDPIQMSGRFGQSKYAEYHTQSPRKRSFKGGASGGMDDRFDMVLHSQAIEEGSKVSYVSTEVLGNDGKHYDDSITSMPNNSAPLNVLQAIHDASDHIPVVAKYIFKNAPASITENDKIIQNFSVHPNPSTGKIFGKLTGWEQYEFSAKVYDVTGSFITNINFKSDFELNLNSGLYTVVLYKESEFINSSKIIVAQ